MFLTLLAFNMPACTRSKAKASQSNPIHPGTPNKPPTTKNQQHAMPPTKLISIEHLSKLQPNKVWITTKDTPTYLTINDQFSLILIQEILMAPDSSDIFAAAKFLRARRLQQTPNSPGSLFPNAHPIGGGYYRALLKANFYYHRDKPTVLRTIHPKLADEIKNNAISTTNSDRHQPIFQALP